ncbi:TolC family protein [Chitinophaga sancti]|uniref:Outer membrane protein TolC n=1 Tax=Chitinophaga sancti TaxID=1004 RepID=A0A1K1MU56_9BACT|nr:TolC family protein [Chitinophaga sancti]WQD62990.1 TolC family protein [Chitinophaga sancti]WQG91385.1 TolC family protein [Chitinophaga sancti]SFW26635.1 Outer membrane protein TolC [Chitinophaga sancti]
MKKIIILLLVAVNSYGQTGISLNAALETGLRNRFDVQANKLDVVLAKNNITRSREAWLPDLRANGEVRYNTKLETMVLDGFNGAGSEKIEVGTKNWTMYSLELSQPLFKPGLKIDTKIATMEVQEEQAKELEKELSIRNKIVEAYLNVILKQQELRLVQESANRFREYLNVSLDKERLHTILASDVLKARTDYENAGISLQDAQQQYEGAIRALKYQLNIDTDLVLTDSLETLQAAQLVVFNIEDRPELMRLSFMKRTNQLRVQKSNLLWLPSVSFIGNYTSQFQSARFDYSKPLWSPYNYIGLKASLPLTELFKKSRREYTIRAKQIQLQYDQQKADLGYEYSKIETDLVNNKGNIMAAKNNLALAGSLYDSQLALYKLGTVSYSTLLDTETSVNTAAKNYIKAVYNYLVSYYNFRRMQ